MSPASFAEACIHECGPTIFKSSEFYHASPLCRDYHGAPVAISTC
jgi:hypothetical protein